MSRANPWAGIASADRRVHFVQEVRGARSPVTCHDGTHEMHKSPSTFCGTTVPGEVTCPTCQKAMAGNVE